MRHPVIESDLRYIAAARLPWERLQGKVVLVTGASGFLPAYMVESLLYLNEIHPDFDTQVIALVRDANRARSRFAHYEGRRDLQFVVQDVSTPLRYEGAVDVIVHAASHASPRLYSADPVGTLLPNVLGTYHLLEYARDSGVETVFFFSSGEVYGELDPRRIPTPEEASGCLDPSLLRSCYAEGKRIGEAMCVAWSSEYGIGTRIVRPFHTYGPGMRLDDGRVFADFVADVVACRNLVVRSEGTARRAFCYIADATVGFFTALLEGEDATPYNVGNEDAELSVTDLAKLIVRSFPERHLRVIHAPRAAGDGYMASAISRSVPDTARLRALGWKPSTTPAEGFVKTVRSFE